MEEDNVVSLHPHLEKTLFSRIAGELKNYILRNIELFNGITNKFRVLARNEEEAACMVQCIKALNLLDTNVFDVRTKLYDGVWCVRIEWKHPVQINTDFVTQPESISR